MRKFAHACTISQDNPAASEAAVLRAWAWRDTGKKVQRGKGTKGGLLASWLGPQFPLNATSASKCMTSHDRTRLLDFTEHTVENRYLRDPCAAVVRGSIKRSGGNSRRFPSYQVIFPEGLIGQARVEKMKRQSLLDRETSPGPSEL